MNAENEKRDMGCGPIMTDGEIAAYEKGWTAGLDANTRAIARLRHEYDRILDENIALRAEANALNSVRDALVDWSAEATEGLHQVAADIRTVRGKITPEHPELTAVLDEAFRNVEVPQKKWFQRPSK